MDKNKVLYLNSAFTVKDIEANGGDDLPTGKEVINSVFIEGYASTNDLDRAGDVVSASVWEGGMKNYLKNPIILANHDYDDPIGRMVDYKIDSKGLWVKARISAAAEIFNLVKDKVVTAFSIGFKIVDAEYNSAAEVFMINDIELIEISVVSIPCNQNTLFDLSKAFDSAADYSKFKAQFAPKSDSAKGLETLQVAESITKKEWNMNPEELKQLLADAATEATKSLLAAQAKEATEKAAEAKATKDLEDRISKAVAAQVSVGQSGAEKLFAEVTKRLEDQTSTSKSALDGLEAAIREKTTELAMIQASKMNFSDKGAKEPSTYQERETAVLLSKITGKSIQDTAFGKQLLEKAGTYNVVTGGTQTGAIGTTGQHLPSGIWELEVSTNMESEVRRRLVVAPLIRGINMKTNVMTLPVNPEAGMASWVVNSDFGAANSAGGSNTGGTSATQGSNSPHKLKEITLNAYKVATKEYLNYEEEEDSLLVIMPIVRDAMVRRLARAVDRAYLMGAGSGADPVAGLATFATGPNYLSVGAFASTAATIANLRNMRKNLGAWGLDPAEVVYVVSTEIYYDLLDDTTFQTMNQVGVQATLLTGQVGQVGNSPVLVSAEFDSKGASKLGALAFAPGNFMAGNQRGLRFDTQELVETQRRVLVASLRTGMTQVTSNLGAGVSKFTWAAA